MTWNLFKVLLTPYSEVWEVWVFLFILYDLNPVTLTFGPLTKTKFTTWIIYYKSLMPLLFSDNPSIAQLCHLFVCSGSFFGWLEFMLQHLLYWFWWQLSSDSSHVWTCTCNFNDSSAPVIVNLELLVHGLSWIFYKCAMLT